MMEGTLLDPELWARSKFKPHAVTMFPWLVLITPTFSFIDTIGDISGCPKSAKVVGCRLMPLGLLISTNEFYSCTWVSLRTADTLLHTATRKRPRNRS